MASVFVAGGIHAQDVGLEAANGAEAVAAAAATGTDRALGAEAAAAQQRWRIHQGCLAQLCAETGAVPTFTMAYMEV